MYVYAVEPAEEDIVPSPKFQFHFVMLPEPAEDKSVKFIGKGTHPDESDILKLTTGLALIIIVSVAVDVVPEASFTVQRNYI
ncbi:MAG: hypothetical protein WDM71_00945 [Ferruginibacter sp.]